MIVSRARLAAVEELTVPYVRLTLEAPELPERPRPGQFFMVHCGEGLDPFLPRPFFATGTQPEGGCVDLLVAATGKGSDWLAGRHSGDTLQVTGWCGRGVAPAPSTRHLLLGAAGIEIAALLLLIEQAVAAGLSVTLVTAPAAGVPPYPAGLLPPEVEVEVAADAGLAMAAALLERLGWADELFACGDDALLRALNAGRLRLQSRTPVWAQRWQPLPCGTGLCMACPVETRSRGTRLLCLDGPWFALRELT